MSDAATQTVRDHEHEERFEIVVDAVPTTVEAGHVSYEQVVHLAYPTPPSPDTRFTVTFRNAKDPKEGSLAPGHSVEVKHHGTIFNVIPTGRS